MPGWDGYPIRERFAARYGAPVWVDNDVNVLALGEWRSGVAAGHDDVVVVKIGTGIGAGIISDGRLHRGAQGSAGDVGHIQVVDDPAVVCRCGNIGCLEALAGGAALGRRRRGGRRDGRSAAAADRARPARTVTAEDVARAASFGDPVAVALLAGRRAAGRLDARERRELLQPVAHRDRRRRREQPGPAPGRRSARPSTDARCRSRRATCSIQRSSLGGLAGVIGASSMVVDQLFAASRSASGWPRAIRRSSTPA